MWDHPITQVHLNTLQSWGWAVISPVSKLLACKDTGIGALAEVETIVGTVRGSAASILVNQSESKTSKHAINTESFGNFFNFLESKRNNIEKNIKNKDIDARERLVSVSYHTLFCITINAMLFIGALARGSY